MRDGKIAQVGSPRDLYLHPRDAMVAEFLGEAIVMQADLKNGWAHSALGRIKVSGNDSRTAARIVLRPEQLSLHSISDNEVISDDGQSAVVQEVEFGGPVCTVTVRLSTEGGTGIATRPALLRVHGTLLHAPAIGARVAIKVMGEAHALG